MKIAAFIGLGVMGFPMAGHIANKTSLSVNVFNRTASKSQKWQEAYKGTIFNTISDAVKDADIIFTCVGNDEDLRDVIFRNEDNILSNAKQGAIIVDHSTTSATVAIEIAEICREKNITFMDAPVSGGQAGAVNGRLTIMVGGCEETYSLIEPIFSQSYAIEIQYMGKSGNGQITKMCNQICIAHNLQGISEAFALGIAANLDMERVVKAISKGSAQSWQLDNRAITMLNNQFDFGFATEWIKKDLGIAVDESNNKKINLETTETLLSYYEDLVKKGHARDDASVLIKRLVS
jgi:3-hydroxyisobutyrate dehydrogenase-like beta-hydroxyacid dehydrogenase